MPEDPIQILEVRASHTAPAVMVTAAVTADASTAISTALSEQLDRSRQHSTDSVEDVLALRRQGELVERFAPLARAGGHAVVQLTDEELRDCLLGLTEYRERVDGEHYQPLELRERLQLTAQIISILWDANGTVSAARESLLGSAAR
jgi:hypothetical protein